MRFVIFGVVLFLSFILGSFGFCQIVGTLKYLKNFSKGSALFTIILWSIILGFGAFVVIKWFDDYNVALYIGYGITFLASFKTTPD